MTSDTPTALVPGRRVGTFEILDRLGAGGMGEVYRARDLDLGRDVAIKVLPTRFMNDAESLARFEREARLIAALNHPNIAAIYGSERLDPEPDSGLRATRALVLELVDGETLAQRILRGPVPIPEALDIARQVALAFAAAHEKGIVHRDLKPANVKLTSGGVIKVLDFGLAKLMSSADPEDATRAATDVADSTRQGTILGTAAYMSPEQARGRPVDKRTDIWAFGCLLFELLTASRAFEGPTFSDTLAAVLEHNPPWGRLPVETPSAIRRLLQRCLDKDPTRRPPDIGDVLQALSRADVGVRAPRRRVLWTVSAVAAVALAAAVSLLYGRRALDVAAGRPPAPQIRSVAVLPLVDLSRSDEEYFANGMTDELIAALSRIRAWRVISRTSVMQYKDATKPLPAIAKELGVDALVEGTIQRSGDSVRISVRLVQAGSSEASLWSESYDRNLRDILEVEAAVARAIASQIKLTLTPAEEQSLAARRSVDPAVLQLYLKGRAAVEAGTEEAIDRGIAYFTEAIQKEPGYAPAHAALALAYSALNPAYRAPKEVMPKSRQHAIRAIELDDTVSEAHTALAGVMFRYDWDWSGAEKEIKRAIELNPSSADAHDLYGNFLSAVGQHSKATAELTLARELNPSALTILSSLLAAYLAAREYDRAIKESARALETHPNFAFAHAWLGMAYVMKGQLAEAIPALKRARALDDNVTTTHFLAMAEAAAGNRAEADRLLNALERSAATRYTCAYEVASVHLRLGRTDRAIEWLRRGIDEQCDCMVWLNTEPWMDPLRVDPRYADLIKRVGFPEG